MGRDELLARLRGLDRAAALLHPDRAFRVVFVGGGALVLLGCLARATADLDALQFPSELVPLMEQYDLSGRVAAYLDHFAINFEDRLETEQRGLIPRRHREFLSNYQEYREECAP